MKLKLGQIVFGVSKDFNNSMFSAEDFYIGVVIHKNKKRILCLHSDFYNGQVDMLTRTSQRSLAVFVRDVQRFLLISDKQEKKEMAKHLRKTYEEIYDCIEMESDEVRILKPNKQSIEEAIEQMQQIIREVSYTQETIPCPISPETILKMVQPHHTLEQFPSSSPL